VRSAAASLRRRGERFTLYAASVIYYFEFYPQWQQGTRPSEETSKAWKSLFTAHCVTLI